jgi:WhiB family redox-sensing transcriptional regulator
MNWDVEAACQSADPELFFPSSPQGSSFQATQAAKRVCRGCPVRTQCLEFALAARLEHGVWGGLTEVERRSLRRSRQRKARRLAAAQVA